jgi:hypothetical protein
MRFFGKWILALGSAMALASAAFVGHAWQNEWFGATCSMGPFCTRPFLLLVPAVATMIWGLLLGLSE